MLTDADLPSLWHGLGIPGVCDVHTHFMPEAVMRSVWAYFDAAGDNYGVPWPIEYRWDDDARLNHLRALGVRKFTALVYAHKPGMAEWLSRWALDFASHVPDCLPTATFYPSPRLSVTCPRRWRAERRSSRSTCRWGLRPRDPLLDPVWGLLADAAVPVLIHCGSAPLAGRFTGPGPIGECWTGFRGCGSSSRIWGADEFEVFLDMVQAREKHMAGHHHGAHGFHAATATVPGWAPCPTPALSGQGKVLFGSDFPDIPYPYAHQVEVLSDHGLDMPEVLWRAPSGCSVVRLRGCCSSRVGGVLGAQRLVQVSDPSGWVWQVQPGGFDQVVASAFGGQVGRCGLAGRPGIRWSVSVCAAGWCSRGSGSAGRGRGRLFDPVGDRVGLGAHVDQLPGGGVGDQ